MLCLNAKNRVGQARINMRWTQFILFWGTFGISKKPAVDVILSCLDEKNSLNLKINEIYMKNS